MKVQAAVKKRCNYCYMIKRRNSKGKRVIFIYCKRNPRHKQRQG